MQRWTFNGQAIRSSILCDGTVIGSKDGQGYFERIHLFLTLQRLHAIRCFGQFNCMVTLTHESGPGLYGHNLHYLPTNKDDAKDGNTVFFQLRSKTSKYLESDGIYSWQVTLRMNQCCVITCCA